MSWTEYNLGELIRVKHGFAFKSEFFSPEGKHIVLTPGNFYESGGFKSRGDKDRFYTGEYPEQYLLKKDDLIVAMTEQGEGLLGSSSLIPDNDMFLHNQRLGLVEIIEPEKVDKYFLYLVFNNPIIRHQISGSATGTKVKHTAPERIYRCKFKFPSRPLQKKIAAVIYSYNNIIENNLKRIKLLEEMAQITYEEWFVRLKFPGHETAVFDEETGLPEGWTHSKLERLAEVTSSKRVFLSDYVEEGVRFYRGKEIIKKSKNEDVSDPLYISFSKFEELKKKFGAPQSGDILITAVGTLGYPYQVSESDEQFYFKDGNLIWLRNIISKQVSNYLISLFQSEDFKSSLNNISIGSSQKALTIKSVKGISLLKPAETILDKFNEVIKPTFDCTRNLLKQITMLKEARDILLPRLMTGMIDIEQVELPEAMLKRLQQ